MVSLRNTSYIYFDLDILKDDTYSFLWKELAKQHVSMFVYCPHHVDEEEVKKLAAYRYVSDVIQGSDIASAISKACHQRNQKTQDVCVITKQDVSMQFPYPISQISITSIGNDGMKQLLWQREKRKKQKKVIINTVTLSCILFYSIYFMSLCWLPIDLIDGDYASIIRSLPAVLLIISTVVGLHCKIYHPESIVEIFDVFG